MRKHAPASKAFASRARRFKHPGVKGIVSNGYVPQTTRAQLVALEREREHRVATYRTDPGLIRDPTPWHRVPRYLQEEDE
jgi:hypothetical protein